jgi:hypothetical protein
MKRDSVWRLVWLIAVCLSLYGQSQTASLSISTPPLQTVGVGTKVTLLLRATGGTPPYSWQVKNGQLPPGLKLDANSGIIAGTPAQAGEYRFTLVVTDSSSPSQQAQRDFTFTVSPPTSPLGIEWKKQPQVHGDAIDGSVQVVNRSDQPFDLTVIILGVNEIGRATALGYQHFTLSSQQTQVIPFGASPGTGNYVVHADAIAEVPSIDAIYRARITRPVRVPATF